jgi:hypothetical protein
MKTLILAATLFAAAASPAMAQSGVSISIGQPNFYGRIDLGGYTQAPVLYAQRPVVIDRQRHYGEPVYLRVPENERRNWGQYCRQYVACGQQVFFVQDGWYSNTYAPHYREQHRPRESGWRDDNRGHGRDDDRGRDYRGHDDNRRDDRGHGRHGN